MPAREALLQLKHWDRQAELEKQALPSWTW